MRLKIGLDAQPSAGIIDSQTVKTTGVDGLREYNAGKKMKGRKWHLLVDKGLVLKAKVYPADIIDCDGVTLLVDVALADFPEFVIYGRMPVTTARAKARNE